MTWMKRMMAAALSVALLAGSLAAGTFVAPADGPVPFRRDRLPVDVDSMFVLSKQLTVLAGGQGGASPEDRRAVAQMLALALALDPVNTEARAALDRYAADQQDPLPDQQALPAARDRIWQLWAWLNSTEAGPDGRALAACLGDVMAWADPEHPRVEQIRSSGAHGSWRGWVADLTAFDPPTVKPPDPDQTPQVPKPADPVAANTPLSEASVTVPLWVSGQDPAIPGLFRVQPVVIRMNAHPATPDEAEPGKNNDHDHSNGDAQPPASSFRCYLADEGRREDFRQTAGTVANALAKLHQTLPATVVTITCPGEADLPSGRRTLSAAAAVLAEAAISGIEPKATILGEIDDSGNFILPTRFWEKLRALSDGPGGRLVLPAEAEPMLPSILALEDAAFFLKYEVLLASNLKELIARAAAVPATPELADLTTKFAEIRAKRGTNTVPAYVANKFILKRLDDIGRTASYHASARMLVVQGSGQRPVMLAKPILARELRRAIQPMSWIKKQEPEKLDAAVLNTIFDECLKLVEATLRHAEMRDRELPGEARDLTMSIRSLARASRGRVDPDTKEPTNRGEFDKVTQAYADFVKRLNSIIGDT